MTTVEHCQIDDHAAENPAFEQTQEQSAEDQPAVGLDEAHEGADEAPAGDQRREKYSRAQTLEEEVGGDVDEDVGDVED